MGMPQSERRALLSRWIQQSSTTEQQRQERAERMVRQAINASSAFSGTDLLIYTKGSYKNNTNVRLDSDVDVVVELQECQYYGYLPGIMPSTAPREQYAGPWTPATWREAVNAALVAQFGASGVDLSGRIAANVTAVPGSRPSADVVPSFDYVRYDDADRRVAHDGSCVFPKGSADKIVNWPVQQLENGRAMNTQSGGRYKEYVRALKNAENALVESGTIKDLPSYFMECLVYNVPVATLRYGNLDEGFKQTLYYLWSNLDDGSAAAEWVEPNELQWLFKGAQKWDAADGKTLVLETWNYLGYGD